MTFTGYQEVRIRGCLGATRSLISGFHNVTGKVSFDLRLFVIDILKQIKKENNSTRFNHIKNYCSLVAWLITTSVS